MRKQQKRHLFPKWTMEKQMEHKVVKKTEVKVEEAKSKKDRELQETKMSSEAELRNIVKPLLIILQDLRIPRRMTRYMLKLLKL